MQDYKELAQSPTNAKIIEEIQSSAFVLSLEESLPKDPVQHSRYLWHGDVVGGVPVGLRNRWVDKPLNFVVYDNAYAGLMGEHSIMDGTPTVRLCDDMLDWLEDPSFDHGSPVTDTSIVPTPLDWEVSPTIKEAIANADIAARDLIETQELNYHLTSYGKDAIKKFGVSPDSWAQLIVQLAYKRLLGDAKRQGGTYEAATTRKFFKGRTEAIRVVSSESDAWVASMDDAKMTPQQRKALFDAAAKKHIGRAKLAGQGQGVDRHMFGTSCIPVEGSRILISLLHLGLRRLLQPGEEAPALFNDPVFARSSNWVLSTSAIFSKHFPVYGWGEVVPEGFGVAYMTGYNGRWHCFPRLGRVLLMAVCADRLQYTITSRKEMPNAKFVEEIAKASDDIYKLHKETAQAQKAKL
jgi:carnitine O-acetyltransferase